MKTGERILAVFLALLLLISVFSATALADTDGSDSEEESGETVTEETGVQAEVPGIDEPGDETGSIAEPEAATDDYVIPEAVSEEKQTEEPVSGTEEEQTEGQAFDLEEEQTEESVPDSEEDGMEASLSGEEPVRVTFSFNFSNVSLDVFSDTDWFSPEEDAPLTYLLLPGDYYYSASCDGCVRIKSYVFSVGADKPEQTVDVELTELGDAFTVIYCDASLEGYDFKSDYLSPKKTGGMLLMAAPKSASYSSVSDAGAFLRDSAVNSDKGRLLTSLTNRGNEIAEKTDNGPIKLSFKSKYAPKYWRTGFTAIYNSAFAHSLSNPAGGDFFVRGRTVGMTGGYDSYTFDGTYYTYEYKYIPYLTTTVAQEAQASAKITELVGSLGLKDSEKTDIEKLTAIYTYITENVEYDNSPYTQDTYPAKLHSAYAAIVEHNTVCQGYATMLYRLCLEAGIDCRSVGIGSGHEWNIVKLGSKWYFLDSTWDAKKTTWTYFLKDMSYWKTNHGEYCPGNLATPAIASSESGLFYHIACDTVYSISGTATHTIIYEMNGGINNPDNPYLYVEGTPVLLKDPVKEGYTFLGWYEDPEHTVAITTISGITDDITVYAAWAGPVTVSFDPSGGQLENPQDAQRVVKYGSKIGNLPSVQKKDYQLLGWYTAPSGGSAVTASSAVTAIDAVTYYAHWSAVRYKITYVLNGGALPAGLANPSDYTVETAAAAVLNSPEKADFIFKGWYRDSSFINRVETLEGLSGNITLYAKYTGIEYYINAEYNGGTVVKGSVVPLSFYYRQKANVTLPTLKKPGYTFKGWYDLDAGSIISIIPRTAKRDYNIQARFSPVSYSIVYYLGGGQLSDSVTNPKSYTIESGDIVLNSPVKTGYTFIGWYDREGSRVEQIPAGSTGKVTLYARYTENSYTLQYDTNGGTGEVHAPVIVRYSEYIRLFKAKLTRNGYTFSGWNKNSQGTGKNYGNGALIRMLSADDGSTVTLYARWKAIRYGITYSYSGGRMPTGVKNPTSYTAESSFALNAPVRKGYTFLGWYDSAGNKVESIIPGMTGKLRLTAGWQKN